MKYYLWSEYNLKVIATTLLLCLLVSNEIYAQTKQAVGLPFEVKTRSVIQAQVKKTAVIFPAPKEMGDFVIKDDKYSPTIEVQAKKVAIQTNSDGGQVYSLIGNVNKMTGATSVGVQWAEVYNAQTWRKYQRASDDLTVNLNIQQISRNVMSCGGGVCTYQEAYNIVFTIEQMLEGEKRGLDFKIYATEGNDRIVKVKAETVQEFMNLIIEVQKRRSSQ